MLNVIQARRQGGGTSNYKDLLQLMIDTTGEEQLEGEQGEILYAVHSVYTYVVLTGIA